MLFFYPKFDKKSHLKNGKRRTPNVKRKNTAVGIGCITVDYAWYKNWFSDLVPMFSV
jgi:hypothetical protein